MTLYGINDNQLTGLINTVKQMKLDTNMDFQPHSREERRSKLKSSKWMTIKLSNTYLEQSEIYNT